MAFKSLRGKLYSKGYHSAVSKQGGNTAFFDSSYNILKQNSQLTATEGSLSKGPNFQPHPSAAAPQGSFAPTTEALEQDIAVLTTDEERVAQRGRQPRRIQKQQLEIRVPKSYYTTVHSIPLSATTTAQVPVDQIKLDVQDDRAWEMEDQGFSPQEFLETHTRFIKEAYQKGDYNPIHALYQSLKRNDIVPSMEVYKITLEAIGKRDFDSLDEKAFDGLNLYQDLIKHYKPTAEVYELVINGLAKCSIQAFEEHNANGTDFFRIAAELFNITHYKFSAQLYDNILQAMNIYPGIIGMKHLSNVLDTSGYVKGEVYYVSMMNYCKFTNDRLRILELYSQFQAQLEPNFKVYSTVVSSLIAVGDVGQAEKFLGEFIACAREKATAKEVSLIISEYLLAVSKTQPERAFTMWQSFTKAEWVPEFEYDFYMALLTDCFEHWELCRQLYQYMYALPGKPQSTVISTLMGFALQRNDAEVVLRLIEESMVKGFTFNVALYPHIFRAFQDELHLMQFINHHGLLLEDANKYNLLNYVCDFVNDQFLNSLTQQPYFRALCDQFSLEKPHNYSGLVRVFETMWSCPQQLETFAERLDLHAAIVMEFYDLEKHYIPVDNGFKEDITEKFISFVSNYKKLKLDPAKITPLVVQAMKLCSSEDLEYFQSPGEWNKEYPLSLTPALKQSFNVGLAEFNRLQSQGYTFDFETLKTLVEHREVTPEIVTGLLNQGQDLKKCVDLLVSKTSFDKIDKCLLSNKLFADKILPNIGDKGLLRIAKSVEIDTFLEKAMFPKMFRSISSQIEFKETISFIYEKLYNMKRYKAIVYYNKVAPALNVNLLLRSCLRSGEYREFDKLFNKLQKTVGLEVTELQVEKLINLEELDEALEMCKNGHSERVQDMKSFILFIKSFTEEVMIDNIGSCLQAANAMSAQNDYGAMMELYTTLPKYYDVSSQMVNNMVDSLQFTNELEVLDIKLDNFLKFKRATQQTQLSDNEMFGLIRLWCELDTNQVDLLFNEIVQVLYVNPKATQIRVQEHLTYNFNRTTLKKILNEMTNVYEEGENLEKVRTFIKVLDNKLL